MKEKNRNRKSQKKRKKSGENTILSMLFSLFLVGLAWLFLLGFHYFLKGQTYHGASHSKEGTQSTESTQEAKVIDPDFDCPFIMIKDTKEEEPIYATAQPGTVDSTSSLLTDGLLLAVSHKISYQKKDYYELKDGNYVEVDKKKVDEVAEYIPLSGYIAITYIGPTGVRIRSWIDFDAENVVESAYVGDTLTIGGMITLVDGSSAFRITERGYENTYITTDTQYFTDFTNLSTKLSEESSQEDSDLQQDGETGIENDPKNGSTTENVPTSTTTGDRVSSGNTASNSDQSSSAVSSSDQSSSTASNSDQSSSTVSNSDQSSSIASGSVPSGSGE